MYLSLVRHALLCVFGWHKVSPLDEAEKQQVRFLVWSSNRNLHPDPVLPRTERMAVVPGTKFTTSSYLEMSLTGGNPDNVLSSLFSSTLSSNCSLSFTLPGKMTRYGPESPWLMLEKVVLQ